MRLRGKHPPATPAERQRKCRAIKRGEWHYIPGTRVDSPPRLPLLTDPTVELRLPAPPEEPRALPAPVAPPVTAMQKTAPAAPASPAALATPAPDSASALALLSDLVTPSSASRLSLPPAVAGRLRSLLERQDAGTPLTPVERAEAQGLLDIAEYFVVQRLRQRLAA
jgi:hypothetical protein